jgi:hypothetical protein
VTDEEGEVFLVEFFDANTGSNCLVNIFASRLTALMYCYRQLAERTRDPGDIKFGETTMEHPMRHPDALDGGLHEAEYATDGDVWWFIHRCYPLA